MNKYDFMEHALWHSSQAFADRRSFDRGSVASPHGGTHILWHMFNYSSTDNHMVPDNQLINRGLRGKWSHAPPNGSMETRHNMPHIFQPVSP